MPLWPFCPAPVVTESLVWNTEVLNPYSTQQAAALIVEPRQGCAFDHAFTFRQYERAQLLMEFAAHGDWDLPVWWERQRMSVGSGVVVIPVDTTTSDYREGGKVVLWQSDEACEALTIDTVEPDSLILSSDTPTSRAYVNAFCTPGIKARCVDGLKARRSVQPYHDASVEWMCYEGVDLADAILYGTYRSHPVINDAPRIGGAMIDMGVSRDQDIVDSETGLPYFDTLSSRVRRPLGIGWTVTNRADLWALRRFLHALRGRQKGFWVPSWSRGLQLAAPVGPADTTLTILAVGLNGVAETGDLMLKTVGGAQAFLRYTAVTPSGGNEVLALSSAAGITAQPADVRTLCRMHFCRAQADLVQLRHEHTGNGQISTVFVRAEEVPIP